jgi:transcriptional regulator with XRE-family HTH domain
LLFFEANVGRRRVSEADRAFRRDLAIQLRAAMKSRSLNQTEAASELGVTKQALSQYLRERSTPQGEILARICAKWGLAVRYRNTDFRSGALETIPSRAAPEVLQLDLFREPQIFENAHLLVSVARAPRSTLHVTIKMKQASERPPRRLGRRIS